MPFHLMRTTNQLHDRQRLRRVSIYFRHTKFNSYLFGEICAAAKMFRRRYTKRISLTRSVLMPIKLTIAKATGTMKVTNQPVRMKMILLTIFPSYPAIRFPPSYFYRNR